MPHFISRTRGIGAYAALVALPIAGMLFVLRAGVHLPASHLAAAMPPTLNPGVFNLGIFLIQVVVVLAFSRFVAAVVKRIGQPPVIGEMIAGLLLGASVLGLLAPPVYGWLFPPGSTRFLNAVSQLGIMLFMFTVGLELDPRALRERASFVVVSSHASIAIPLFLGAILALYVYPRYATSGVPFPTFALFLGASLSVTAFPVLARLLTAHRLTNTRLGSTALACAAVADVTAWLAIAPIVIIARLGGGSSIWWRAGGVVAYLIAMATAGAWLARRIADRGMRDGSLSVDGVALVVIFALASAWMTEMLGIHALFGAFVAGLAMPKRPELTHAVARRFEDVMIIVLVPIFFAYTGLRTRISIGAEAATAVTIALVIATAVAGKIGGTFLAARVTGVPVREALTLGVLMNTRGMMELIILNVGLDIGVLSPPLFGIMVLMAVATTMMTAPLLGAVWTRHAAGQGAASQATAAAAMAGGTMCGPANS